MLKKRIISSLWIAPLVIVAVWFGEPGFTIVIALAGAVAAFEFYKMVSGLRIHPLTYFGIVLTLLFILSRNPTLIDLLSQYFNTDLLTPVLTVLALAVPLVWILRPFRGESHFSRWIWTVTGIFYIGWLLSHLVALRGIEDGRNWVMLVVLITFASDTSAFFVGRAIGKHRLAPNISPAKTWEGATAGVLAAAIVSLAFILETPFSLYLGYWQAVPLAIAVSIFGQLGDLLESWFKRTFSVKDSGTLIPGHGGVLDRLDSVVFAGLVVYYYVIWIVS